MEDGAEEYWRRRTGDSRETGLEGENAGDTISTSIVLREIELCCSAGEAPIHAEHKCSLLGSANHSYQTVSLGGVDIADQAVKLLVMVA